MAQDQDKKKTITGELTPQVEPGAQIPLPKILRVANGPYFSGKKGHHEIHLRRSTSPPNGVEWTAHDDQKPVPNTYRFRVIKIRLERSAPSDGAPDSPFDQDRIEKMKKFRSKHASGRPVATSFRGKAWYKCTYELERGEVWDPHFVIDWP